MFIELRKKYEDYDKTRQLTISQANQILHKAKQAIFAFHREEIKKGEKLLNQIEPDLNKLKKSLSQYPSLKYNGPYKAAIEEYVEAKLFWQILKFDKMEKIKEVQVEFDDYLAGICDLTGELVRKMIFFASKNNLKRTEKLKVIISDILDELVKINLVGYLRHKFDEAKHNLEKAEQIIYEMKIRRQ